MATRGRPGERLRALASRVCSARALERLIDPAIADLQSEHAQAPRAGWGWRRRWIRVAGTLAFWKVIGLHAAARAVPIAREWAAADRHALGRTSAFAVLASGIVAIPFVLLPLSYVQAAVLSEQSVRLRLVAYLLPQALPICVPVGVACGILFGLRQGAATARIQRSILGITIVCGAIMFVVLGWVVPETNQAFREILGGRRVMRGTNELPLGELWARGRSVDLHMRLALPCAAPILGLFALSVSAAARNRSRALVAGLAGVACYCACFSVLAAQAHSLAAGVPAALAAWTPNLIFAAAAARLLTSSKS
jgi:lipopolysaccharide export LptBFGC system permease protein LptF